MMKFIIWGKYNRQTAVPLLIAFTITGWGELGTAVLSLVVGYNLLKVNRDEPL